MLLISILSIFSIIIVSGTYAATAEKTDELNKQQIDSYQIKDHETESSSVEVGGKCTENHFSMGAFECKTSGCQSCNIQESAECINGKYNYVETLERCQDDQDCPPCGDESKIKAPESY